MSRVAVGRGAGKVASDTCGPSKFPTRLRTLPKTLQKIENRGFQRVSEEFRGVQRIPENSREFQRTLLPKTLLKTLQTPKNTSENTSKHIPNTKNTSKNTSGSQESPGWLSGLTWACFAWRGGNLLGP